MWTHLIGKAITSIDVNASNASVVTHVTEGLNLLTKLGIDIDNVSTLERMCENNGKIEEVSVRNMGNVANLSAMFGWCYKLRNVKGLNFGGATDISDMFSYCQKLQELDLRTLDISKIQNSQGFVTEVPKQCLLIFNTQADYNWFQSNFGNGYVNVSILSNPKHIIEIKNAPSEIYGIPEFGNDGATYTICVNSSFRRLASFKVDGVLYENTNSFTMPAKDVIIEDIVVVDNLIFESEHNPYHGAGSTSIKICDGEVKGAEKLKLIINYGFDSTSNIQVSHSDRIVHYTGNGEEGKGTYVTEEVTTNSNSLSIYFYSSSPVSSSIDYYGYKVTIVKLDKNGNIIGE